jgi:hypothetical protein
MITLQQKQSSTCGAEAWPISRENGGRRPVLEQIIVASEHGDGRGALHLTPDQALYVQSRLTQIAITYLPHHQWNGQHPHEQATTHPNGPADHTLAPCGAAVWPILGAGADLMPDLEQVVIASDQSGGSGPIHLSPDQVLHIEARLTHITLAFLHDNGWGGEDARDQ